MTKYRFDEIAINSTQKKKPTEEDKVYYIGLEHIDPGCFDVVRWGSDVAPTGDKLLMQKGDVLFGKRRAYQRKVAIAPFDGIFSAHGMVLRPNLKVIDANYFPFFISSDKFMDTAVRISVGGLSPTINWKDLARQEFELPSLDEQKVLAYKLWAAYRLKEAYKKLLVATDEIVKSQFIEMFGNPLSSKQKNELKRLGQCCIINPRRPNIALCDTDKVSFIPMPAVSEDGYLVDMADEEYGKVKKGFTYFENNDVLFAKITPCMENGKGAIAYGLTNGIGVGSTEFHVLRPINGISSPYWLLTLTRMPIFRERAAKNMSGTGGQKRVSASYLNHFMVGLPAIEEQRRFEAIYKQADKSKFGDFKSQFIEMFGTVENNTHNFPIMTIGEFAYCFAGATPSTSHPEYWENGRIRWMSSGEVHKGHVEDTDSRITELGYKSASTRMVPIHSIVIAIAGQGKTRGTVAITEVDLCTNQSLCAIVPDERVNYSYLYHNLQGRYLELRGLSGDVNGRGGLNLKIIQKIPVILPPIEKQQQFASIAQQADKSKFELRKSIDAIDKVIKSLINN